MNSEQTKKLTPIKAIRASGYVMRHKFLAQPEQITRHYGIRPAIFEGVLPVYAVVMLQHPDQVILSMVKEPAASHYCHDLERANFGYDEEHSHV